MADPRPWRFVTIEESYPDFSCATSPAVEKAVAEGHVAPTALLDVFSADGITIGVNEDPTQVLDLDVCREAGIVVRRRVNGGGAIYAGQGSMFLALYLPTDHPRAPQTAAEAFPAVLTAFAEMLEDRFGVPARYRPLNDVEIDGRKVMPTSIKIEDGVMTCRLLLNVKGIDADLGARAMPMAPEKVQDKANKTLQSRFTWLEREVGRELERAELEALCHDVVRHAFGVEGLVDAELTERERRYAAEFREELARDAWFFGKTLSRRLPDLSAEDRVGTGRWKAPGGLIWATLVVRDGTVRHAVINGDFHPRPIRSVAELEAGFAGLPAEAGALRAHVEAFLARPEIEYAGVEADDICGALDRALAEIAAEAPAP